MDFMAKDGPDRGEHTNVDSMTNLEKEDQHLKISHSMISNQITPHNKSISASSSYMQFQMKFSMFISSSE